MSGGLLGEGPLVTTPRKAKRPGGRVHTLAYINPDEAELLRSQGGGVTKAGGQLTWGGVPSFDGDGDGGGDGGSAGDGAGGAGGAGGSDGSDGSDGTDGSGAGVGGTSGDASGAPGPSGEGTSGNGGSASGNGGDGGDSGVGWLGPPRVLVDNGAGGTTAVPYRSAADTVAALNLPGAPTAPTGTTGTGMANSIAAMRALFGPRPLPGTPPGGGSAAAPPGGPTGWHPAPPPEQAQYQTPRQSPEWYPAAPPPPTPWGAPQMAAGNSVQMGAWTPPSIAPVADTPALLNGRGGSADYYAALRRFGSLPQVRDR